ncbi:hypothetical protein GCM10010344_75660 [Streptomyces bluensis]|nr:hypothetical protein GCM10010344_75660 [Streptomyces bluensis]
MGKAGTHVDERLSMGGVIDEAATARVSLDEKGTVTGWNAGAERLLGYGATEMVGRGGAVLLADGLSSGTEYAGTSAEEFLRSLATLPRWNGRVALPGPEPEDDRLTGWSFAQTPCCAMALYDAGLRLRRANGPDRLGQVLAQPAVSLDALCDRALGAMLSGGRPTDDIPLLVARTRALDADHVATLDVPADPAMVAGARRFAADRLGEWGLDEAAYVTELVVSELVTNAIRHAAPPVQLRLILDRTLICEVSDASCTAPHLRRARTYDEGGRGLMPVAQLTRAWGTRHTALGKTIWAEQALPAP